MPARIPPVFMIRTSPGIGCAALWLTLMVAGCRSEPVDKWGENVFVDDLGRQISLESKPERIISLAPNITELLCTAGACNQIAGVSEADDYPPEILDLPRFSAYPLNVEAVVALQPDLVVAIANVNPVRSIQALEHVGIPVFVLDFVTLSDIWNALSRLGRITGNDNMAKKARSTILSRLDEIHAGTESAGDKPTVFVVLGTDRLYSFGADSYMKEVISLAGGISISGDLPGPSTVLTEEAVIDANPDVIVGAFIDNDMDTLLDNYPSWHVLSAVENNRLCSINPDYLLRPGPRLVNGIEAMATCLSGAPPPPDAGL